MHRTRAAVTAIAILSLLFVTACADREGTDDGSEGAEGTDTSAEAAAGGEGEFGDLGAVCGPNEGGGATPSGDAAETLGITDDAITVGTIADPGYEGRPGLNQEIFDTATAFVEWCNEAGGVNGRQLEVNLHDAAITAYAPAITEACATDFAIVGDGAVLDDQWAEFGPDCGLIDIAGFSVTAAKAGQAGDDPTESRTVAPLPVPADQYQVGPFLQVAEDFPEAIERAGVMWGNLDTLAAEADAFVQAVEPIGYEVVHESTYNILGEANWAPLAQGLADDDVQVLHFVGEPGNLAALLSAMDDLDYRPEVVIQPTNFYDESFLEAAGPAAEGVLVQSVLAPFEEADEYPAVQQYLDMVEATDGKVALLGMQSLSGWLLFAQAATACDLEDDLTRSCVLEQAASVDSWTGGGLHAETDPSSNSATPCFVLHQVQDGAFERYAPDEGYDCGEERDQEQIVEIDG